MYNIICVYVCVYIMYFIFAVCLISHSSLTECVLLTNFHSKPILHLKTTTTLVCRPLQNYNLIQL